MEQARERGKFTNKSDSDRQVRSIRATEEVWNKFGELAEEENLTRADFLERFVKDRESLPLIEEIKKREEKGIEEKIRELILGLEKSGKNELNVPSKEKAIVRRALSALVDYLVIHG